jgi:rare lipoprotein A (peptidoglycan hydrolase)
MHILTHAILRKTLPARLTIALGLSLTALTATPPVALGQTSEPKPAPTSSSQAPSKPIHAKASWYGPGLQGRETSTGETFDSHKLTAASSKLPLGSTAEVKNLQNGRKVKVQVNDCGPNVAGRKVDLSSRAADKLKMKHAGVVPVEVKVLHKPADAQPCESQ